MHLDCKLGRFLKPQSILVRRLCYMDVRFLCISQKNGRSNHEDRSPFQPSQQQLRTANRFFEIHGPSAVLEESGVRIADFKKLKPLPEVALLGRTSVGKSSLINVLLQHKKLARISKKPGHTRLINFFNVGAKFYVVDLPGYGYVERLGHGSRHFVRVAENYLKQRAGKQLKSVCLLVDGKVGIKKNDLIAVEMLEEMDAPYHIAITKMDKVNPAHRELSYRQISRDLGKPSILCYPHYFPVSSKEQTGLSELRYFIGLCTGIFK